MAVFPALIAVVVGLAAGVMRGGKPTNIATWRVYWWPLLVLGLVGQLAVQFLSLPGGDTTDVVVGVGAEVLLVVFALLNLHISGMSILAVGLLLNIVPTVLNSGMPVNSDAMVTAGVVEEAELDSVVLTGNRHIADDDDTLAVLGDVIPIPVTRQVISIGDVVVLIGLGFVVSSLMQRRRPGRGISYEEAIRGLAGADDNNDAGETDASDAAEVAEDGGAVSSARGGQAVITGADQAAVASDTDEGDTDEGERADPDESPDTSEEASGHGGADGGKGGGGNGKDKPDTGEFEIDMERLSLFAPGGGDGVVIDADKPLTGGSR